MNKISAALGMLLAFIVLAGIYLADVLSKETIDVIELGTVETVDYELRSNGLAVYRVVSQGGEVRVRGTFPHLNDKQTVLKVSRNKSMTLCYLESEVCSRVVN